MDSFDLQEARRVPRRRRSFDGVWNILALILLVMSACVVFAAWLVYSNPYSAWNPFPPATELPLPPSPTPSVTMRFTLEPSWTPTFAVPTLTPTPGITHTPIVTATPYGAQPASETTAAPTVTPGGFAFDILPSSPSAIQGAAFHPELGCDWTGVAGQVLGMNGEPLRSQFIHLGGTLDGQVFDLLTITGSATSYGPAGFEFILANRLVASNDTLWIQLEDVQMLPMSAQITFDTFADCDHNLVIIYLQQVR